MIMFFFGGVYIFEKVTIFSENYYFRTVFRDLRSGLIQLSELRQNTIKSAPKDVFWRDIVLGDFWKKSLEKAVFWS